MATFLNIINVIVAYFLQIDNIITVFSVSYTIISVLLKAVKGIQHWIRERAIKKLLGFKDVVIHIPSRESMQAIKEARIKPVIAMEDYNTAEKMRDVLINNNFNVQIKYIPSYGEIEFEENKANLVICGPKNSPTVKRAFDSFKLLGFKKDKKGWYFIDTISKKRLYSPIESNTEQYAFLGKIDLSHHDCLLICGIHAIGSDGVAHFLNDPKKLDQLLKIVGKSKFYCVICSEYGKVDRKIYSAYLTNFIGKLD